jgi:hypothetical protein
MSCFEIGSADVQVPEGDKRHRTTSKGSEEGLGVSASTAA